MLSALFKAIDSKDHVAFSGFLAPDCLFRFGNHPEVLGIDNVQDYVKGFFGSISDLAHELHQQWEIPNGVICHGKVTYIRMDGSKLSVPFANVFELDAGKIKKYLIFVDTSDLYK